MTKYTVPREFTELGLLGQQNYHYSLLDIIVTAVTPPLFDLVLYSV